MDTDDWKCVDCYLLLFLILVMQAAREAHLREPRGGEETEGD